MKNQLIKEFDIKNLGKVKKIIRWEIIQDLIVSTLKIDQKMYIQNRLEFEKMTYCQLIIFLVEAGSTLFLNQAKTIKKPT